MESYLQPFRCEAPGAVICHVFLLFKPTLGRLLPETGTTQRNCDWKLKSRSHDIYLRLSETTPFFWGDCFVVCRELKGLTKL